MGLFGFGSKKEEKKQVVVEKKRVALNRRKEERYLVKALMSNYGEVIDIAQSSVAVMAKSKTLSVGDFVDLKVKDLDFDAHVSVVQTKRSALVTEQKIPQELIAKHLLLPKEVALEPRGEFNKDEIFYDKDMEINRAIINLMLEIEDPNTSIEKFQESIENLPKLKEMLLKRANSIEHARGAKVEDIKSAITRLGFERVKEVVYEYVNYDINLSNTQLASFKDFDIYTLLLTHLFKNFASLTHFKDIKAEGQSLLSMSYIGAVLISKESQLLSKYYKSAKELFSLEMRLKEKLELGVDMLDVCRLYFLDTLGVFRYIYDGFVLAHLLLTPSLEIDFSITLSQRKLKFAYVAYLTLLAQKFILAKDTASGQILFARLRRYGLSLKDAKKFLDEVIADVNKKLAKIGIEKRVMAVEYPSFVFSVDGVIGKNIYAEYFKMQLTLFSKEGKRLALRYEDSYFAHNLLDIVLQSESFSFRSMPYIVIPCERLADEDLSLDQFSSFDILLFKNVDRLPKQLFNDFKKIWSDFEGKIIVTYDKKSMIDYSMPSLFALLHEVIVDVPSYFQSPSIYLKMVQNTLATIERFSSENSCDLANFKDDILMQKGVYLHCLA